MEKSQTFVRRLFHFLPSASAEVKSTMRSYFHVTINPVNTWLGTPGTFIKCGKWKCRKDLLLGVGRGHRKCEGESKESTLCVELSQNKFNKSKQDDKRGV